MTREEAIEILRKLPISKEEASAQLMMPAWTLLDAK